MRTRMRIEQASKTGFDKLPKNQVTIDALPAEIAAAVKTYNRYKNILPNPISRVVLSAVGEDSATKFINANYVPNAEGAERGYIATQGIVMRHATWNPTSIDGPVD